MLATIPVVKIIYAMRWLQVTVFKRALTEPQKEAEYSLRKRVRIYDHDRNH